MKYISIVVVCWFIGLGVWAGLYSIFHKRRKLAYIILSLALIGSTIGVIINSKKYQTHVDNTTRDDCTVFNVDLLPDKQLGIMNYNMEWGINKQRYKGVFHCLDLINCAPKVNSTFDCYWWAGDLNLSPHDVGVAPIMIMTIMTTIVAMIIAGFMLGYDSPVKKTVVYVNKKDDFTVIEEGGNV